MRLIPILIMTTACTSASASGPPQDVFLIPDSDSDTVWAFSAVDGSLVTNNFINDPGTDGGVNVFDRPLEVLIAQDGTLLVVDQFSDIVSQFSSDGSTYLGIFSLEGVRDTNIMNNIRGGHVLTQGPDAGDVLVTNSGPFNDLAISQNNIKRLEPSTGAEETDFAFNRYGGIRGPFDVIEYNGEVLVADEGQDKIVRYTLEGKFNERFTSALEVPQLDFPQQMAIASNGNLLVCAFSSGFILEFNPDGSLAGQYDPGTLELYRGIAELDNGNFLVTTTSGVFEVTRTGLVIDTEAAGSGFRYLTRHSIAVPPIPRTSDQSPPIAKPDTRDRAEILRHELGLGLDNTHNKMIKTEGSR
ncbi:MAG: hypothetical protein JJ974_00195 [Phycisphaerales bacterium]|nr:hypothetical protein [Phycisphaerales bacterium]